MLNLGDLGGTLYSGIVKRIWRQDEVHLGSKNRTVHYCRTTGVNKQRRRDGPQDDDDDDEEKNSDDGDTQRQNNPQRVDARLTLNNIRRLPGHGAVQHTLHRVERLTERRRYELLCSHNTSSTSLMIISSNILYVKGADRRQLSTSTLYDFKTKQLSWRKNQNKLVSSIQLQVYASAGKVHLASLWPWPLTSDLENLFSNVYSRDEYLWQVSLISLH